MNNKPVRTEFRQRAFDGKWEEIGLFMDHENKYTYKSDDGQHLTLIPEKWITMKVYDYLIEIVD